MEIMKEIYINHVADSKAHPMPSDDGGCPLASGGLAPWRRREGPSVWLRKGEKDTWEAGGKRPESGSTQRVLSRDQNFHVRK